MRDLHDQARKPDADSAAVANPKGDTGRVALAFGLDHRLTDAVAPCRHGRWNAVAGHIAGCHAS